MRVLACLSVSHVVAPHATHAGLATQGPSACAPSPKPRHPALLPAPQVHDTVFATSYLVLGLGDVYLGAPCAVPFDPRQRLVTAK